MADNQIPVSDLKKIIDELISEHRQGIEEVHLEPPFETVMNAEPETQPVMEEPVEEERPAQRVVEKVEEGEAEEDKDFIFAEAKDIWTKVLADKGFICDRGFGKLISHFSEIIEKRGWESFCAHTTPRFSTLAKEFYANMVGMRDDTFFVRGVWVPFGGKRINEMFKLKELKHGSKFKKLVENPNHEKIIDLLTVGQGKWEATKKNPHYAINRGSLPEKVKVLFYFFSSVILPTKHLYAVREQEAIILYALLKGYKMNVEGLIKGSIKGYHLSNKRGLILHPTTISKLCIFAGVRGAWDEEETCPKVSPLTLTGVTKGPRNKKQQRMVEVEAEHAEDNDHREMEAIPEQNPPAKEEEVHFIMSPLSHSYLDITENFPEQTKSSRIGEGNIEIMKMLRTIKKDMEEREKKWEKQQQFREELLEFEFRRKEQLFEHTLRQREEEWKEEMNIREEEMGEKMKASLEAFYNNQFRRDEEVLTILKKREAEMEGNMLKTIQAFKYLYKEQFREFGKLMKDRDKELEDNDVSRRKIWHESLDLINKNLSDMLGCISELEKTMNQMGSKQDTLIRFMDLTNDLISTDKVKPTPSEKNRLDMTFSQFSPCLASFDLDPPNIIPKSFYKKREGGVRKHNYTFLFLTVLLHHHEYKFRKVH